MAVLAQDGGMAFGLVHGGVHQHLHPSPPLSWPLLIGVIPREADSFQRRAEAGGMEAAGCQVLTGMGGVGKTQLAAHHARRAWQAGEVDLLLWINATSRQEIAAAYADAAARILHADRADPEAAARAFLAWLEPRATARDPVRWLIVLDDLGDPADLHGLWPPAGPHGRTLVTTRRREASLAGRGRRLVTIGLFSPGEAVGYLATALDSRGRHEPREELAALARELGRLPLALAQAAAYLVDTGLGCAAYRRLLADRARAFADMLPDPSGLPDDQTTSAAAAWSLSLDRADQLPPAGWARPMLRLAAVLSPNGIPAAVLTALPALAYLADPRGTEDEPAGPHPLPFGHAVAAERATRALRALHRLSLLDHAPGNPDQSVRVHQLVQRAVRDDLGPGERESVARVAADALAAAWPTWERDAAQSEILRANAEALQEHAPEALYRPDGHVVLTLAGDSLGHGGQRAAAVRHYEHVVDTARALLGPDHRATLDARGHLANWRGEAGDPAGAAAAFAGLLTDRERVLGPGHPRTLIARRYLALWRGAAGLAAQAVVDELAGVLADARRLLGPGHVETLRTWRELADARGRAGDPDAAVHELAGLLAHARRVLAAGHHLTHTIRADLAGWLGEAGHPAEAAAAFAELLADAERLHGPHHTLTLSARQELAHWRGEAGEWAVAAAELAEALEQTRRLLGPDHPQTLAALADLAHWRARTDDPDGAIAAFAELLTDSERILGPGHPDTLETRRLLAHWRGNAGDPAAAVAGLAALAPDVASALGPDSADLLRVRTNLVHWRRTAGETTDATAELADILVQQRRVMGPDHPDTLNTRHRLALWHGMDGDPAGAAAELAGLLHDQARVLGPHHPDTLSTRSNWALWRGKAGDAAGAAAAFAKLVPVRSSFLGPDHPTTLRTRFFHGYWLFSAGDAARAAAELADVLERQERRLGPGHDQTAQTRHTLAAAAAAAQREGR